MKYLLPLIALAFVSCTALDTTTPAPSTVPVPEPVATPDIARTEAQVRKVEEKVDDVEDAVRDVGSRLEAARVTADSIEAAVEDANGLSAGSAAADELRAFVGDLKTELKESTAAREKAMEALTETKAELVKTQEVNADLRSQITSMAEQNKTLASKLEEANVKIQVGIRIAKERDEARWRLTKVTEQRDSARKYVWGVWIGIAIIVVFVILKIVVATGKWTPQGRAARFFF